MRSTTKEDAYFSAGAGMIRSLTRLCGYPRCVMLDVSGAGRVARWVVWGGVADRATPDRLGSAMNDVVSCPTCALPASVADRFSLASTDGPLEHVRVSCVGGHNLVQLTGQVDHLSLVDPSVGEMSDSGRRAAHRR